MKFAIKKKIYQISAYLFLSVPLFNQAHATGVPVADAAAIAQMITEYMQQLKDYTTQLDSLQQEVNQYEQQMKDAAKPVENAFDTANSIISSGTDLYNYVNNLSERFSSARNLLDSTIGSRQKWEECALSSSCNPVDMAYNAYNSLADIFDDGMTNVMRTRDSILSNNKRVTETFSTKLANTEGHQAALEIIGQTNIQKMKQDASFQGAVLDHQQQENLAKATEMAEKEAAKKQTDELYKNLKKTRNEIMNTSGSKLSSLP